MYDFDDPELQKDFAHRYIHSQLLPEERIAFEEYLMDHPELVNAIETDKLMNLGLSHTRVSPGKPKERSGNTWLGWLLSGAGVAYLSVLLFGLVPGQEQSVQRVDRVVYIDAIRSADSVQKRISLGKSSEKMVLMLSTEMGQTGPFNIKISKLNNPNIVAEVQNVEQSETNDIVILVEAALFEAGLYQITTEEVSSRSENTTIIEIVENTGE